MNFNVGDVVQLKSGGPLMTITSFVGGSPQGAAYKYQGYSDDDVIVEYFVNNVRKIDAFRAVSLTIYQP
ncbi:DUF2158 domain-containing protein [Vibrio cholerae]|uniref:YodC family protein n=1 Tax=Vibrio cholerae TaxID=666 RepID=UPI000E0C9CFF|nr:DUF2158 domain-containing protein [Vibrio cholerae]